MCRATGDARSSYAEPGTPGTRLLVPLLLLLLGLVLSLNFGDELRRPARSASAAACSLTTFCCCLSWMRFRLLRNSSLRSAAASSRAASDESKSASVSSAGANKGSKSTRAFRR